MPEPSLRITKRDLPHWDLPGSAYFVTWRVKDGQPELAPVERDLVAQAIQHFAGERYHLYAWVVMNDHVHVLFRPMGEVERSEILHSWKSFTANQLQRKHGRQSSVWQDESFDRIVRDEDELLEKWNYILTNPAKRWQEIQNYK